MSKASKEQRYYIHEICSSICIYKKVKSAVKNTDTYTVC